MKGETLVPLTALNAANRRAEDLETQLDILQRDHDSLIQRFNKLQERHQSTSNETELNEIFPDDLAAIKDELKTRMEQWINQGSFNRHSIRTYLHHFAKLGYVLGKKRELGHTDFWHRAAEEWKRYAEINALSQVRVQEKNGSGGFYYDLFKFFSENHGLTLVDTEIQDIIHAVNKFEKWRTTHFSS